MINFLIKIKFYVSLDKTCLSAVKSHKAGGAKPVSDSLIPATSLTRFKIACISSSVFLIGLSYGPQPFLI